MYTTLRRLLAGALLATVGLPVGAPGASAATPSAPVIRVVPANARAALAWAAPVNGGRPITDYVVQFKKSSTSNWTTFRDGVRSTPGAAVTPLVNKTAYDFRVAARNSQGVGAFSRTVRVTPGCPTTPGRPKATPSGGAVFVTWPIPSDGGFPMRDYRIQYSINAGASWVTYRDPVENRIAVLAKGLPAGKRVIFRVAAVNSVCATGYGPASAAVTAPTPPVTTFPSAFVGAIAWRRVVQDGNGTAVQFDTSLSNVRFVRKMVDDGSAEYDLVRTQGTAVLEANGTVVRDIGGQLTACTISARSAVPFSQVVWNGNFTYLWVSDIRRDTDGFVKPEPQVGAGPIAYFSQLLSYEDGFVWSDSCGYPVDSRVDLTINSPVTPLSSFGVFRGSDIGTDVGTAWDLRASA